jgi:Mg2+ and Co2+ transporter CorA
LAKFCALLRALSNDYYRVHNHIMRETESLHELRETNNSLLTTKQNETMRIFTILAFLTFPPHAYRSNLQYGYRFMTPIVGDPHDFWILLGMMGIATLGSCSGISSARSGSNLCFKVSLNAFKKSRFVRVPTFL